MSLGITLDTGALIALERRERRMREVWRTALERKARITVPTAAIAEWWRGRSTLRDDILASVDEEPLQPTLARLVGEALAAVPRATVVDAIVMASAAQRGDVVYTSDFDDLDRLRGRFPAVRVLRV